MNERAALIPNDISPSHHVYICLGELMCLASWLRKYVSLHPSYQQDSILPEDLVYDMLGMEHLAMSCHVMSRHVMDSHVLQCCDV